VSIIADLHVEGDLFSLSPTRAFTPVFDGLWVEKERA
jgi:hypothetical protein